MNPRAIAVYNPEKKELVGIFRSGSIAARYLKPLKERGKTATRILHCADNRYRMHDTIIGDVAIRYANAQQVEFLKNNTKRGLSWINEGYPKFNDEKIML